MLGSTVTIHVISRYTTEDKKEVCDTVANMYAQYTLNLVHI